MKISIELNVQFRVIPNICIKLRKKHHVTHVFTSCDGEFKPNIQNQMWILVMDDYFLELGK